MRIGILQLIPQLEDAVWGFISAAEAALGAAPALDRPVRFEIVQAAGRESRCRPLAECLVRLKCDLLFGGLTPAVAALKHAAAAAGTPVVFAPLFHPVLSGILPDEAHPGIAVTGVSGRLDPQEKIAALDLLFPALDRLTIIAGAGELSRWEAGALAAACASRGIRAEIDAVGDGPPQPAAPGRVHLLAFSPELEETMESWIPSFHEAGAPVAGSSARAGFLGAVLSVFADHGELGCIAGEMAAEILKGASPHEMPVRHPPRARIGINYYAAGRLGIRIPPRLGQTVDAF